MLPDRRRILIVSYEFPPIQGPGIWRTLGFARHLPPLGWQVEVLCSDRSHWHARTDPALLGRIPAEVPVHRVRGVPFGARLGRVLPERVVGALRRRFPDPLLIPTLKLITRALTTVAAGRGTFVLTSGPPHVVHLVGLALKRWRGCTWVADYRDPWMDDPALSWVGSYRHGLGLRAERMVMREADLVTTVTPSWHRMLAARRPGRATVLIRNAADLEGIELPVPERPCPAQDRVLLFPGTPQPGNSAATLWEGIRRHLTVAGAGPRCRFAFLGLHADMHALVRSWGIGDRVEDLGPQPHRRALALMQGADGILVPVRATPASAGVIPAKIYEAIALRKFVLLVADPEGDAAALVRCYGRGTAASSRDPDSVVRALDAFARMPPDDAGFVVPPPLAKWSRTAAAQDLDRAIRGLESGEPFSPTCP